MATASQSGTTRPVSFERERGVYEVTVTPDIAHVVVKVGVDADRTERLTRLFRLLADASIPVFLIKLHRSAASFAVNGSLLDKVDSCFRASGADCRIRRDLALLTIVATSMRDLIGVMVTIGDALQHAGARVYATGDSHNSVQCLIEGARVPDAVRELNRTFRLGDDHA